ncbi:M23 family metallopeptidase [Paenibacillus senegalimassiliensis]|uniref:M23 family metallopeptidase n=1 Tax=Paenibacillus senegalimassiliensis TaxID=1737426 RepID=UPI00073EC164|nr:M23 family metallopeptidase [Paenibacillus senegalimassiliensis]
MDVKTNVRKRREQRIRELTMQGQVKLTPAERDKISDRPTVSYFERLGTAESAEGIERDPELLWKRGQGRWQAPYAGAYGGDGDGGDSGPKSSIWSAMFARLMISAMLFAGFWGIHHYEPSWASPIRVFVAQSLTEEMDFKAIETWYTSHFGGAPSFIPIFETHEEDSLKVGAQSGFTPPLEGSLAGPFALSLKGVEIVPDTVRSAGVVQVRSIETGRILSVANDALTGLTVTVQHAGGYVSVYGRLDQISVDKGDWLEGGDVLGTLPQFVQTPRPTLYFALKKEDRYIDPADVVPLD